MPLAHDERTCFTDAELGPIAVENAHNRPHALNPGPFRLFITKMVHLMETYEKPVIGVSLTSTQAGTVRPVDGMRYSGVFYQTPENAVNVLSRMVAYRQLVDIS